MNESNKEKTQYSKEELKKLPFMDNSLDIEKRIDDLLSRLTFEEKCLLCAGAGYNRLPEIPRLGIKGFGMTDGPHGVSPGSIPDGNATYFPTGTQIASTWNPELAYKIGQAIAEEVRAVDRHMSLGPAINMCRNPMNGRTFEYYSEDPYLAGEIATEFVKGLQNKRIAPCVKHFVANNQETNRFKVNAIVSRRALEEIYFPAFRKCVEEADAWGFMSSYNKVNGIYVSEHKEILREILKNQWKFSGVVVSDWGATKHTTGIKSLIEAGLDIEMGSRDKYNIEEMKKLKEQGEFPEKSFEDNIRRILRVMFRVGMFDDPSTIPPGAINTPEHQQLARKVAEEGMVLLKNESNLLPLDINKIKKIALIGKHADMKFGRKKIGGGSSAVHPPYEVTIREGLKNKCQGKIEIIDDPKKADVAIVCIGLDHTHDFKGGDHEGSDHLRYSLGILQPRLVNKTAKANPNTIVVCVNGSPFGMEKFINNVPAVLEAWYGGMELGNVVADILFGDVNPSGKLPLTFPKCKKDIPTALSLWQTLIGVKEVEYKEGVFIGYRYYESYNVEPTFWFGHGLSYTKFEYSNLELSKTEINGDEILKIKFILKNIGERIGGEVAQLYIRDPEASVPRPYKELKRFKKVFLVPNESKSIEFEITKKDLAFFDETIMDWKAEDGEFEILIGSSLKDIRLQGKFVYKS
ncbi:MAG: beta-glucosidase family protein [Promethearchaeota archaeon]